MFAAHVWFCWYVSLDVGFGINNLCKQRNIPSTIVLSLRRANFSWFIWHANLYTFRFETYKNVTIFQNGHLVPDPKLGEDQSGSSPKELKRD